MSSDQYFAGLIDGEGCIGMQSEGRGRRRRLEVKVNMTCRETVVALHARFGGQIRPRKLVSGCRQQWEWRCTDRLALAVLKRIASYSITKRELIAKVIG
jgi:hypothetical protein